MLNTEGNDQFIFLLLYIIIFKVIFNNNMPCSEFGFLVLENCLFFVEYSKLMACISYNCILYSIQNHQSLATEEHDDVIRIIIQLLIS